MSKQLIVVNGKAYIEAGDGFVPAPDGSYTVADKAVNIRTAQQNRALHKYFAMVAEALTKAGLDIKQTIKADVSWTPDSVKDMMWRPLQIALLKKKSTTALKKNEIDAVYHTMNRLLGEKFGIHIPFPSVDEILWQQKL